MIVLDSSAMIEWLLQTTTGAKVRQRTAAASDISVPHLVDVEVAQSFRKLVRLQQISAGEAQSALQDLIDMDLSRYAHDGFLPRIWSLRNSCTAYDAVYIALAESLGAPLVTCDRKLASSHGHNAKVELI